MCNFSKRSCHEHTCKERETAGLFNRAEARNVTNIYIKQNLKQKTTYTWIFIRHARPLRLLLKRRDKVTRDDVLPCARGNMGNVGFPPRLCSVTLDGFNASFVVGVSQCGMFGAKY